MPTVLSCYKDQTTRLSVILSAVSKKSQTEWHHHPPEKPWTAQWRSSNSRILLLHQSTRWSTSTKLPGTLYHPFFQAIRDLLTYLTLPLLIWPKQFRLLKQHAPNYRTRSQILDTSSPMYLLNYHSYYRYNADSFHLSCHRRPSEYVNVSLEIHERCLRRVVVWGTRCFPGGHQCKDCGYLGRKTRWPSHWRIGESIRIRLRKARSCIADELSNETLFSGR